MEADRCSAEIASVKELDEQVSPIEAERKHEEASTRKDASNTEAEGAFKMCEGGGEQQSVRVEAQPQKEEER